jgi:hypothetical protein
MHKNCENCGKEHDGSYGSGRFCSTLCSRSFSTKDRRQEINSKVSETLLKKERKQIIFRCKCCSVAFPKVTNSRICSDSCKKTLKSLASKLGRVTAKERGTFVGWKARTLEH